VPNGPDSNNLRKMFRKSSPIFARYHLRHQVTGAKLKVLCPDALVILMTDPDLVPVDASAATTDADWLALMDRIGDEAGYFQPLGTRHHALFLDEAPTLVVTFECLDDIRARPGQLPLGYGIAKGKGWSHLCIIADGATWWRDPAVYRYFDRLVDDAFFEDFDRVLFYGADMGAYAACAYAVTAPGATVLAINPRATLAPALAGWDARALAARRMDFTSRYGFAPDMTEGTGQVFVIHDPTIREDAMHAALFRAPWITHLKTPHLAGRVEWALAHMNLLPRLIEAGVEGRLTADIFAKAWRARRQFGPYLKALLASVDAAGKPARATRICRSVVGRLKAPMFRKRLAELERDAAQ
jgi:hypothetical protein